MKSRREPQLHLSIYIRPEADRQELDFVRQLGVTHVYTWVRDDQIQVPALRSLREQVEDAGLVLYNVGHFGIAKNDRIHLALPGREEAFDRFRLFVHALGEAGIHLTTFTWEPTQVWSTGVAPRDEARSALARFVDMEEVASRPFTHGRAYTREEIWDNYTWFITRILPEAETAGVRLALHPNDPPAPVYGGVPSLIHSAADFRRAFETAGGHASLGMEFCTGCWLEGGAAFGNVLENLREFIEARRVRIVHFRNVSAPMPRFSETFLDNGYMDMYKIMRLLVNSGYDGTVTLDHTPNFPAAYNTGTGTAYAIGYMRALLQRALEDTAT
ncbi:MAG: TIM barrel protein [Clostridiaceae bacterium]|jgi:mannonate dehydratase|nr:TIM barrel protein [Clostridiaceae bacterium]